MKVLKVSFKILSEEEKTDFNIAEIGKLEKNK